MKSHQNQKFASRSTSTSLLIATTRSCAQKRQQLGKSYLATCCLTFSPFSTFIYLFYHYYFERKVDPSFEVWLIFHGGCLCGTLWCLEVPKIDRNDMYLHWCLSVCTDRYLDFYFYSWHLIFIELRKSQYWQIILCYDAY